MQLLYLEYIKGAKNLLAFSGGVDSSALFFLLLEQGIGFDIALVDYGVRLESQKEIEYAKELSQCYNKRLFIHTTLKITHNFEHNARIVRYEFFSQLCREYGYNNVLMAHQLNDRLEWYLMQLCKGSGLVGLNGLEGVSKRGHFSIIRPLIETSREEIYQYLQAHKYRFFEDSTNYDISIKRNFFRHTISNILLREYATGVRQSFRILEQECKMLRHPIHKIIDGVYVCQKSKIEIQNMYAINYALKKLGYVMSYKQRKELVKTRYCCQLAEYIIDSNASYIFIAKSCKRKSIPKVYREQYRIASIPPKVRPILFTQGIIDLHLVHFMQELEKIAL